MDKYRNKIGMIITIPEELKEANTIEEKIRFFFNKKRRNELKEKRNSCMLRINSYVERLVSIDIEKLN